MRTAQEISSNIFLIGENDRRTERFENIFPMPNGITYNSYIIMDEKIALLDTVDRSVSFDFLESLENLLNGREIDYLVINHMEPDHCADIEYLCDKYSNLKVLGNAKTFQLISQFFTKDLSAHFQEVKELEEISLGAHKLRFYMAPMVHWPEVMFTYETTQSILFSADAFGTFGAFSGGVFNDQVDFERDYLQEARRYYANIVGKYGPQVQAILKKVSKNEIKMICPLHGPIWRTNLSYFIEKYNLWSQYIYEEKGVVIAYASMYGNTERAANKMANQLAQAGVKNIHMYDVSKTHTSFIISDIFRFSHLVLAAPTYNMGLYLPMHTLLHDMSVLNVQNKKAAIIANGSWAPAADKIMKQMLGEMKNVELLAEPFVIKSTLKDEQENDFNDLSNLIVSSINE